MKKRGCLKKYANGTGVQGYIEDPADTMVKHDIMVAKAEQEANNNPWIPVTMMAGQVLSSAISSGAFAGTPTAKTPVAANGMADAQGAIEAEKGEVVETPSGNMQELAGNKHESGGTPISVPPGTKIFSDRIVKNGKTMADRKLAREKKFKNLEALLENKDTAIVNTAKRTKDALDKEEQEDLRLQEIADSFANLTNQFAYGTGPGGLYGPELLPDPPIAEDYAIPTFANNFYDGVMPNLEGLNAGTEGEGIELTNLAEDNQPVTPQDFSVDKPGTVASRALDTVSKGASKMAMPTAGDLTGLVGNLISSFGPLKNTLENRAGDTPNVNKFKDFGKEALEANANSMEYVDSQKNNALRRITDKSRGSKRAARNSARGVNTQRALDLGIDLASNEADLGVNDTFARQMMELFGQKSQLENMQDQVVMSGEQEKDLNNRKDRDNFYTQKAKDIATMGTGVQQTGKDINAILKNPVYLNLLNEMGKYFTVNSKGELEAKTT